MVAFPLGPGDPCRYVTCTMIDYDDNYPTCIETHSTLRVFSDTFTPDEISSILQLEPTDSYAKGDTHGRQQLAYKTNGWLFSTFGLHHSRDTRRHLDLILSRLKDKDDAVNKLHSGGCELDIVAYWVSAGQGGPEIEPNQM